MRAPLLALALGLAAAGCRTARAPQAPAAAPTPTASEVAAPGSSESAKTLFVATFREAEAAHHRALERDARDRGAFEGLARLYYEYGVDHEPGYLSLSARVIDQGERALATSGQESAELALIRGLLELRRQHPERAAASFRAALRVDPGHAIAALNLARLELRFGAPEAALAHLEVAAADPTLRFEVLLSTSCAHLARDEPRAAEVALLAARALAPSDPRPHFNLGRLEMRWIHDRERNYVRAQGHVRAATLHLRRFLALAHPGPEVAAQIDAAEGYLEALAELDDSLSYLVNYRSPHYFEHPSNVDRRRRLLELEREAAAAAEAAARADPR